MLVLGGLCLLPDSAEAQLDCVGQVCGDSTDAWNNDAAEDSDTSDGGAATGNPLGGDLSNGMAEPDVPTQGISLQAISESIQDAFCAAAGASFLTGAFLYVEGEGMVYLGRNAPPACGTLACAVNPAHCDECRNHWQRLSDLAGGTALKTLGALLGAAGGAGLYLCDD